MLFVFAMKGQGVPWYAKLLMALIILIPDFIPVIGQIDDLIIVPAGIALVIKLITKSVMEEYRQKATAEPINTRTKWVAAAIFVSIWALVIYLMFKLVSPLLFK